MSSTLYIWKSGERKIEEEEKSVEVPPPPPLPPLSECFKFQGWRGITAC